MECLQTESLRGIGPSAVTMSVDFLGSLKKAPTTAKANSQPHEAPAFAKEESRLESLVEEKNRVRVYDVWNNTVPHLLCRGGATRSGGNLQKGH